MLFANISELKILLRRTLYYYLGIVRNRRFWILFIISLTLIVILYSREWYDHLDFLHRFTYWFLLIAGGSAVSIFYYALTRSLFFEKRISPYLNISISTFLSVLTLAFYAKLLMHIFIPKEGWLTIQQLLLYSLCIVGTACIIVFFSVPFPRNTNDQFAMKLPAFENELVSRLPFHKRGSVICLEMNDHYVKITTINGTELLHTRMSDAVAQLKDQDGLQIHRSYWINKKHIKDVARDGRKYIVRMSNGTEFPISESYIKNARDEGII